MSPRPRRRSASAVGTAFVLIGAAAVLGAAFTAGVYTGTWWSSRRGVSAGAARASARDAHRAMDARTDPPMPTLTFYHELMAPLTAPPPLRPKATAGNKATGGDKATAGNKATAADKATAGDKAPAGDGPSLVAPRDAGAARAAEGADRAYTVQVGAYRSRAPAEALAAQLSAAGHEAEIVTAEATAGPRYRVCVGAFRTRDAAREAAARIAAERALPTLVTVR